MANTPIKGGASSADAGLMSADIEIIPNGIVFHPRPPVAPIPLTKLAVHAVVAEDRVQLGLVMALSLGEALQDEYAGHAVLAAGELP
jgi:hypothetical protein